MKALMTGNLCTKEWKQKWMTLTLFSTVQNNKDFIHKIIYCYQLFMI